MLLPVIAGSSTGHYGMPSTQIPANRDLYEALRAHVAKFDGPDAVGHVDAEYRQQQDTELVKEFI